MPTPTEPATARSTDLELIAGHRALDFANTAGMHASSEQSEWLTSYAEVLAWAAHAGVLKPAESRALHRAAAGSPARAAAAWRRILSMRETIYRIFAALARRESPTPADLEGLHRARIAALRAGTLAWRGGAAVEWRDGPDDLLRPLHPLVLAATDLLASPQLTQLKQCGRHPCGWLFLDGSRNRSRRWCTSQECGNVTRVRRFRKRHRQH